MTEYIAANHMSVVTNESEGGYYLPHHAVIKTTSLTTKVRVVFDASAKSKNGMSLNDTLITGPTIQSKLFEHLTRFRMHRYVLTADIAKMYRQVLVHPDDRRYQRIFWQHEGTIKVFELNTVTFGVSAAPFLAIRTLHQLATDEGADYPVGAEVLKRDLYVDDLLTGATTIEEIIRIRDEVIDLLKRGGFHIRQWASNDGRALKGLSERVAEIEFLTDQSSVLKTLGVSWNAHRDQIIYVVNPINPSNHVTKRYILSEIAKIFDPLDLLGPVILAAKVIMQECWRSKIFWDESVPNALYTSWRSFAEQLELMNELAINRHLIIDDAIDVQIHGFSDASKIGYGACLYMRSRNNRGEIRIQLICAKSRVAPLKTTTIPRLELCGAVVLARLYQEIKGFLVCEMNKVVCWSDSTIVLHWLKKTPGVLKVFEANRVGEVQESTAGAEWRHVRSEHNPADALSRGQYPREFLQNQLWFQGPSWLQESEATWPRSVEGLDGELPGLKRNICLLARIDSDEIFTGISSYSRLIRVIAYCLRMLPANSGKGELTVAELIAAEQKILKLIQQSQFAAEIHRVATAENVKGSRLSTLNPFIDDNGLLCVGGRLRKADLPVSQKHAVLLPSRHHVTDLIIQETHEKNYHAGIQSTLYTLRHRFWLLDGKNQVRKIIRNCVKCIRFRASPAEYRMADLPKARVEGIAAFHHTGVDFFGPMFVKEKKLRNRGRVKVYGCVFICMSSKAVHIEIVSDLSSEAFLAALRRFVARRAIPAHVYSDNGTNFVGANGQLRELYALIESEKFRSRVNEYAISKRIEWHFNPPLSPHFGGIWEAAVKSFKHHFRRVVGKRLFTFEELNNLAIEIEAILNSRPLCPLSTDPNDPLALTPAHLLVGRPLTMLPEMNFDHVAENRLSSWHLITKTRQDFWRRWQIEYLSELQKRQKWTNPDRNLQLDDIVVLIDKNQPCMRWRLGRIIGVHPGDDGVIRVVTIRT